MDEIGEIFEHMDFDTAQLKQLWADIQEMRREHPTLWSYKIASELNPEEYDWKEGYNSKRILPALKDALEEHGIISIEEQSGHGSDYDRKVWVFESAASTGSLGDS